MTKTFKVRKYQTGKIAGKNYFSYRFRHEKTDWNYKEIEELDCKILLIFSEKMTVEDIDKVKNKWKHKIFSGE